MFCSVVLIISRGLAEGLQLMREGSKCRFWVASELRTADTEGDDIFGAIPLSAVPEDGILIFDMEMVKVRMAVIDG